jgi:hypothetical protein
LGDGADSDPGVSSFGSQEAWLQYLGCPDPDAVDASYGAFAHVKLSPRLEHLKNTDFKAFKVCHGLSSYDAMLVVQLN